MKVETKTPHELLIKTSWRSRWPSQQIKSKQLRPSLTRKASKLHLFGNTKTLTWRTSLQAAIIHLCTPWLPHP